MKNFSFVILFLICFNLNASEKNIDILKEGKKIIFIRHSIAPGVGDPKNFKIDDCKTQRNLSEAGIKQSIKIGNFFLENKIPIDKVLSSEWCRCKDTAKYAFKKYKTFSALNSFFDQKFKKNKESQIKNLKLFLKKWENEKNLILVTHYVVIQEMTKESAMSGEMIITDKKLNILGKVNDY